MNKNIDEHRGFSFNEVKYSVNKTVKDIKSDIEINKNYKPRKWKLNLKSIYMN